MRGLHVPSLSTIYVYKPMRNHTLMQTIARANRVFLDKANGLIVDYVGVFRDLQKALAIYGSGSGGGGGGGGTPGPEKRGVGGVGEEGGGGGGGFWREEGGGTPERV